MEGFMEGTTQERQHALGRKLDAAGWGLFVTWIGIALLWRIGWGTWLFGTGLVVLGGQLARRYLHMRVERVGIGVGIVLAVSGAWQMLEVRLGRPVLPGGTLPLLAVVAGVALFLSAVLRKVPEGGAESHS